MRLRVPLTIRVVFRTVCNLWMAGLLALAAWVGLADATPDERAALGASVGEKRPEGLVAMRVARAMVHFAPDRAARMLSEGSNGEISVELAAMILRDAAKGPVAGQQAFDVIVADEPEETNRTRSNTGGAKFISVD